jgi:transcriptional regulator with XRE-family HTH domain
MFGAELKRLRESVGLSQAELSRRTGVAQQHLSRIESGDSAGSGLSVDVYLRICDALGVGCDHFRPHMGGETPADIAGPKSKRK